MQWFGHVYRLPNSSHVKIAYEEGFVAVRPKGRPPNDWCIQLKADTGLSLLTAISEQRQVEESVMKNVERLSRVCK